jgi:hypothetical protein
MDNRGVYVLSWLRKGETSTTLALRDAAQTAQKHEPRFRLQQAPFTALLERTLIHTSVGEGTPV